MSVPMKKHRTKKLATVIWQGNHYAIPVPLMDQFKVRKRNTESVNPDEAFRDLLDKYGESGVLLRGLRYKENLNQVEFAKIIGVSQTNLSAMENGRRAIGKALAKRIADQFGVDYRLFL